MKSLHLRPRLGRRRAKRGLATGIVILLALSALAGWLLWQVLQRAAESSISSGLISSTVMPLAMAPLPMGYVLAFGAAWLLLAGAVMAWGVRKRRQNDMEGELRWWVVSPSPVELQADDLRGIIWALTTEACTACEHVSKAQKNLSVEDCGERLAAAEKALRGMIECLGGLMENLNAEAARGGRRS